MTFKQPITTKGDLLVRDADQIERLPIGADGSVVIADATEPLGVKWGGDINRLAAIKEVDTDYQVLATDHRILVDCNGTNRVITLPNASEVVGLAFTIKKIDSGGQTVTIEGAA